MISTLIIVKKNSTGRWDVFENGRLIQGGFFYKDAAYQAAATLRAERSTQDYPEPRNS